MASASNTHLNHTGAFAFSEAPKYEWADTQVQIMPLGGCWWPVWVRQSRYDEVVLHHEPRSEAEARAEAEQIAMRLLREKICLSDDLVDKWIDYCMIEGGKLAAYATAERRVDIGSFVPHAEQLYPIH